MRTGWFGGVRPSVYSTISPIYLFITEGTDFTHRRIELERVGQQRCVGEERGESGLVRVDAHRVVVRRGHEAEEARYAGVDHGCHSSFERNLLEPRSRSGTAFEHNSKQLSACAQSRATHSPTATAGKAPRRCLSRGSEGDDARVRHVISTSTRSCSHRPRRDTARRRARAPSRVGCGNVTPAAAVASSNASGDAARRQAWSAAHTEAEQRTHVRHGLHE